MRHDRNYNTIIIVAVYFCYNNLGASKCCEVTKVLQEPKSWILKPSFYWSCRCYKTCTKVHYRGPRATVLSTWLQQEVLPIRTGLVGIAHASRSSGTRCQPDRYSLPNTIPWSWSCRRRDPVGRDFLCNWHGISIRACVWTVLENTHVVRTHTRTLKSETAKFFFLIFKRVSANDNSKQTCLLFI